MIFDTQARFFVPSRAGAMLAVTINAIPARDGTKHLGWISKITYADGHYFLLAGE